MGDKGRRPYQERERWSAADAASSRATARADDIDGPIMQPRCIYCKREHYALAVFAISLGNGACMHCHKTPPVFTSVQAYRDALRGTP